MANGECETAVDLRGRIQQALADTIAVLNTAKQTAKEMDDFDEAKKAKQVLDLLFTKIIACF